MNFDAFTKDIIDNNWKVFGAEVYEKGVLTHSFGDTADNIHEIYSATKTVLSIAVGIAVDEGRFDRSKCILDYMPKNKVDMMSEEQRKTFELITVERLLTMSVADLPFRPEGDGFLDFSLACKIKNPEVSYITREFMTERESCRRNVSRQQHPYNR